MKTHVQIANANRLLHKYQASDVLRYCIGQGFDWFQRPSYANLRRVITHAEGSAFQFELMLPCWHKRGVYVSGGVWHAFVPLDEGRPITMEFVGKADRFWWELHMPYRPSLLPLPLMELATGVSVEDDPFGGAANWIPFQ